MKMILMGSGTSYGVPVIGCGCRVCTSTLPEDKRYRCSAYITGEDASSEEASIVIDTGPEFRLQAIKFKVRKPDAVLITHSHADHLNGLDDIRVFSHTFSVDPSHSESAKHETEGDGLPIYTNSICIRDIRNRFDYIFMPVKEGGGKPKINLIDCDAFSAKVPISIKNVRVIPVRIMHGTLPNSGWLITCTHTDGSLHSVAYLTDTNLVPEESVSLIKENAGILEHLVIDGLRIEKHSTHFCFEEALCTAEKLLPRHTWITHLTHDLSHRETSDYLLKLVDEKFPGLKKICEDGGSVAPAYDGAELLF